jgi:hypothetical protein
MGSTGPAADNAPAKELTGAAKNQGDHKDVSIIFPPTFLCGKGDHSLAYAAMSQAIYSFQMQTRRHVFAGTAINIFQNSGAPTLPACEGATNIHFNQVLRFSSNGSSSLAGDENTNWAWYEKQKKIETNMRLRFSLGAVDDLDGLNENHDAFTETRSAACHDPHDGSLPLQIVTNSSASHLSGDRLLQLEWTADRLQVGEAGAVGDREGLPDRVQLRLLEPLRGGHRHCQGSG